MILRFIVENVASFKEAVEFNTFPSSKSQSHGNHKMACGHVTALRMSAIYGANGAGKSNLFFALRLLKSMIEAENLRNISVYESLSFKLDDEYINKPSGLAIEYYHNQKVFYYHIEFDRSQVYTEELLLSKKSKDEPIFKRENNTITIYHDFFANGANEQFVDGLQRLLRPDMLLLPLIGKYYSGEFPDITNAYAWFTDKLQIVGPNAAPYTMPHLLDIDKDFESLVNSTIPEMGTGISGLKVLVKEIDEDSIDVGSRLASAMADAKQYPGVPQLVLDNLTGEILNVVYENDKLYLKTLMSIHIDTCGETVETPLTIESDGTRRIIEYMPLLYAVTRHDAVYIVDEVERSIHPILIKDIINKLSKSTDTKGQLIFTTHESALLDQDIFRPDEIWFAQKDIDQATQLYPLSDFNIHKTANIENGYLNGRYGGIPFLSNLKDLHW
jgi:AAA15 family ATPase/GTPase